MINLKITVIVLFKINKIFYYTKIIIINIVQNFLFVIAIEKNFQSIKIIFSSYLRRYY